MDGPSSAVFDVNAELVRMQRLAEIETAVFCMRSRQLSKTLETWQSTVSITPIRKMLLLHTPLPKLYHFLYRLCCICNSSPPGALRGFSHLSPPCTRMPSACSLGQILLHFQQLRQSLATGEAPEASHARNPWRARERAV